MIDNKDGMRYPSIDQLAAKTQSKYKLVVGAAKRAKELQYVSNFISFSLSNKLIISLLI